MTLSLNAPICALVLSLGFSFRPVLAFEGLAILGDSTSTGAGSHPKLEFDSKNLWDVFNAKLDLSVTPAMVPEDFRSFFGQNSDQPARVGPSRRENDGGTGWIWHNVSQGISARTIEAHSLSYGYLLGRKLGHAPENILIAGENGTTSRHAWIHAARLVDARQGDLPSKIILFYTGNDLCSGRIGSVTTASDYGDSLLEGMKYLALNGHAHAQGTKIYIPSFLTVTTLLHEPSILAKKIRLHGEEVTCEEARNRFFARKANVPPSGDTSDPRYLYFSMFMPPSPVQFCPTLFGPERNDSAHLSQLANRIRSYRDAQKNVVERFNEWRGKKLPSTAIEAVFVSATETLQFGGDDVGADCFHLSSEGQAKVARTLFSAMK
jgi:lysophospholipase L1-like esterase